MYLDPWMIVVLILSFGVCAHVSSRRGIKYGSLYTLKDLLERNIIAIRNEKIVPGPSDKT